MVELRLRIGNIVEVVYTPAQWPPGVKDELGTEALFQSIVGKRYRIKGGAMPWYRGVECRTCKQKLALESLSGPKERTEGRQEIECPECRSTAFYGPDDFIAFETLDPITVPRKLPPTEV
jgi:DNA-directed RNA polymerase subunit RPC12/RpoP